MLHEQPSGQVAILPPAFLGGGGGSGIWGHATQSKVNVHYTRWEAGEYFGEGDQESGSYLTKATCQPLLLPWKHQDLMTL